MGVMRVETARDTIMSELVSAHFVSSYCKPFNAREEYFDFCCTYVLIIFVCLDTV